MICSSTNWIENYIEAGNTKTDPARLAQLALSEDYRVRLRVAENENTSAQTLEALSSDSHAEVRLAVASNRSTPVDVTYRLAFDSCPTVRLGMAEDPSLPRGVLKILSQDENPYVYCRARSTLREGLRESTAKQFKATAQILSWPKSVERYA